MACNPIAMRDGAGNLVATGFACGPRKRTKPCVGCGGASELLCDWPLTGAKAGKTCSAPICRRCTTKTGPETDLCPPHARERERHIDARDWLEGLIADEQETNEIVDKERARATVNTPWGRRPHDSSTVVGVVAALPANLERPPWERVPPVEEDLNAVDRDALGGMFPQWPDVATTYDDRRESSRADELHGHVPRDIFEPTDDGRLTFTPAQARDAQSAGSADSWWGAPHGEVTILRKDGVLGERALGALMEAFPGARVVEAPEAPEERRREAARDRPAPRRGGEVDDFAAAFAAAANVDRELAAHAQSIAEKVSHVKRAGQTRGHTCHWTGCERQCPPAMWGCRDHWYTLPKYLRDKIWNAYRTGQETTMTPSREYLTVAREVDAWIERYLDNKAAADGHREQGW